MLIFVILNNQEQLVITKKRVRSSCKGYKCSYNY